MLDELRQMADEEDRTWESGQISGSYYCGDHEHYEFMTEAFGLYAHVNALQRDVCPSATKFEGGDFPTIIRSIEDRLFSPLDADVLVLPGHGDNTTIGAERPHLQEWVDRGW